MWLGSVVVMTLDLQSASRGFDSWLPHCQVATCESRSHVPSASDIMTVRNLSYLIKFNLIFNLQLTDCRFDAQPVHCINSQSIDRLDNR